MRLLAVLMPNRMDFQTLGRTFQLICQHHRLGYGTVEARVVYQTEDSIYFFQKKLKHEVLA